MSNFQTVFRIRFKRQIQIIQHQDRSISPRNSQHQGPNQPNRTTTDYTQLGSSALLCQHFYLIFLFQEYCKLYKSYQNIVCENWCSCGSESKQTVCTELQDRTGKIPVTKQILDYFNNFVGLLRIIGILSWCVFVLQFQRCVQFKKMYQFITVAFLKN